ncbi:MAG: VWA domain-containing protein, partial [Thermoguttaceae bacterium]
MSKNPFFLRWMSLPLATVLGVALTLPAQTQVLGGEAARLDGFTQADGGNVFALTLKPSPTGGAGAPAANGPRDVVILVSTAASQTGDYRAKSLATLESTLSKLDPGDRVKLIAFDLNAAPLTEGFVAPNSPAMSTALRAIEQRTPLGSCDLEKALETAAKSFAGDNSKSAHAIVYIGDGSSRANVLTTDQLDRVVNDLVAQRAPVIAFGVGPQIQEQLLGILASRTGGIVAPELASVDASAYGAGLARAVHGTVLWPKAGGSVKWPDGMEVYPKTLPPLRSDRDTVVVGTAKSTAAKQVEIEMDGPTGAQKLAWDIPELKSDAKNGYLVTLVDQAKSDGGRTLPLIDSASLSTAKREIEAGGRGLTYFANEALKGGNLESANNLAGAALSRNPNDKEALAVKDAIAKNASGVPAPTGAIVPVAAAAPMAGKAGENVPAASEPGDLNLQGNGAIPPPEGVAAEKAISESTALEERWQKDVQNTINQARSQVSVDPGKAAAMIQNKTSELTAETALRPEMRERLMGMLRTAGLDIKHRADELTFRDQQRNREEAARREMEMTNQLLEHDIKKVDQLMQRFDSLMDDARQRLSDQAATQAYNAAQQSALEADKIVDRDMPSARPAMRTAMHLARFEAARSDIMAVRVAKQKGFVDAMYQTEKSHVPTPDDPPIIYPDAEFWKDITARRKKWSSTELSRRTDAEKKIDKALKEPTQIEFVETPLKDVVDYLKDLHKIEIQLDSAALKDGGVDESTQITKNLHNISLRSALKLLLDELKLKYVIHNEVLLITTPEKAESDDYMTTKVYPVADLVLPIQNTGMAGGFGGMGGMMGGMGGMMGGMGMGGGMMGGGMMGGMGGGMGGMGGGMGGMGGG